MQAFLLMHNNYHTTVLGLHITVTYACCMSCQFQQLNNPPTIITAHGLCDGSTTITGMHAMQMPIIQVTHKKTVSQEHSLCLSSAQWTTRPLTKACQPVPQTAQTITLLRRHATKHWSVTTLTINAPYTHNRMHNPNIIHSTHSTVQTGTSSYHPCQGYSSIINKPSALPQRQCHHPQQAATGFHSTSWCATACLRSTGVKCWG